MNRSYVVTGGAQGIGRAIAERLSADGHVVVLDLVASDQPGVTAIAGDASLHEAPAVDVLELIALNLGLAVTGCATAVRRFLAAGNGGAIVNVSSHQATRPVRGALPYATAKAAIEGLTRAIAVDYGPRGIRANAVALGSIANARLDALTAERPAVAEELAALHPLGRAGRAQEVAAVVAHLLSDDASFVSGAVVPVDGGRAVIGQDPEAI